MSLNQIYHTFSYIFNDKKTGFKASDQVITFILAAMRLEYCYGTASLLQTGVVSSALYFVFDGVIDVQHKDQAEIFLTLGAGSYFGDISYFFRLRNSYTYSS
jgi:CRP-like cAMP-binding protein